MGQKVSPVGLRIGINKDWESNWYEKGSEFSKKLIRDIKIREYLEKKLKDASVSKIEIDTKMKDNSKRTEVKIFSSKPGIVIGRSGAEIENMKKELSKIIKENVGISVVEIKNPNIDASIVAQSIASALEGRGNFRILQKKAIRNAMKSGAKGMKTLISGRLNGAEIARSEGYSEGNIPLHTLRADIDYSTAEAHTIYGILGVKVWIYKGEILDNNVKGAE